MVKKIISYNVNGIRAAISKGFAEWLTVESPDIICLQEIKANEEQFDVNRFREVGYSDYWFPAMKKGYSGVAILSKEKPDLVVKGMGIEKYDFEGRYIRADFGSVTLINSYFPSGTSGDERQEFKMGYLFDMMEHIRELKKERPNLIISGDYNICHKPIDINHPELHEQMSGFLPEERAWFDQYIDCGLVDSFREFNKEPRNYSWWSYRAGSRARNMGWRIDYHIVSAPLRKKLKSASILKDVVHSDHCPVVVELDF